MWLFGEFWLLLTCYQLHFEYLYCSLAKQTYKFFLLLVVPAHHCTMADESDVITDHQFNSMTLDVDLDRGLIVYTCFCYSKSIHGDYKHIIYICRIYHIIIKHMVVLHCRHSAQWILTSCFAFALRLRALPFYQDTGSAARTKRYATIRFCGIFFVTSCQISCGFVCFNLFFSYIIVFLVEQYT